MHASVKLAWTVKSSARVLLKEMEVALENVPDKEILVGERLNVGELLRVEALADYEKVGVVVCSPSAICGDVRALVEGLGRAGKTVFELEIDAFSW
jgi:hypothetical protein